KLNHPEHLPNPSLEVADNLKLVERPDEPATASPRGAGGVEAGGVVSAPAGRSAEEPALPRLASVKDLPRTRRGLPGAPSRVAGSSNHRRRGHRPAHSPNQRR